MTRGSKRGAVNGRPDPQTPLPTVAEGLGFIVSAAGLKLAESKRKKLAESKRKMLERLRDHKAGDWVAAEGSLLREIEEAICNLAGEDWAGRFRDVSTALIRQTKEFAREFDSSAIRNDRGRQLYRECVAPDVIRQLHEIQKASDGPDIDKLLARPFRTWREWAEGITLPKRDKRFDRTGGFRGNLIDLLNTADDGMLPRCDAGERIKIEDRAIHAADRVLRRYDLGKPIRKITPKGINDMLSGGPDANRIVGWFILTRLIQNAPCEWKDELVAKIDSSRFPNTVSLGKRFTKVSREPMSPEAEKQWHQLVEVVMKFRILMKALPPKRLDIDHLLNDLKRRIEALPYPLDRNCMHLHHHIRARLEVLAGHDKEATEWFDLALKVAWWRAGWFQEKIIRDALLHAVLIGDKAQARQMWDRAFFLELNNYDKPVLEDTDLQRLAIAAEKRFPGRRSKRRVATGFIPVDPSKVEKLISAALRSSGEIDRISVVDDDGRFRLTPLMCAAMFGTVEQVEKLIDAGADIAKTIPESGRGVLSIALENACQYKDRRKLDRILKRLQPIEKPGEVGWNRPSGTQRVWPLALAIELGEPDVVKRLLDLGANPSRPCRQDCNALYYALSHYSIGTSEGRELVRREYLEGHGHPSAWDARLGAVFSASLSEARRAQMPTKPGHREIFQETLDAMIPVHTDEEREKVRKIVRAILDCLPETNRKNLINEYVLPLPSYDDEWTSLLFAVRIGDSALVKMLLEEGGDPGKSLKSKSPASDDGSRNAFWMALKVGNTEVLKLLKEHGAGAG